MRAAVAILLLCATACAPSPNTGTSPASSATAAPPWFEEVAAARGINFVHRSGHEKRHPLPEIMGGGAALFDMDGDRDLDILLVQSGRIDAPPGTPAGHRLYRNRGDGAFDDVSEGSGVAAVPGYGMGVATGDYDNDGDVDVYITNLGANVLLQNDGKGRFADVTRTAGVAGSGWSTSATFADLDADGDLDLFVTRYLDWRIEIERECYSLTGIADYCSPKNYDAPTSDLLFRNNGNGTFTDISRAAGLTAAVGNGLGVIADDVNGDGRLDLFVANDGTPNHLWINLGSARFAESALMAGVAIDQDGAPKAGMGVHAADLDDDGDNDLIVMNLDTESDSFFRNEGRFFVDDTVKVGLRVVSRRFTRFGVALLDFDNDGLIDLYEANGRVGLQAETFATDPYAEPNLLFRGVAGGRFEEVTPARRHRTAADRDQPRRGVRRSRQRRRHRHRGREPRRRAVPASQRRAEPRPLAAPARPRAHRTRRGRRRAVDRSRHEDAATRRAHGLQLSCRQRPACSRRPGRCSRRSTA